VLEKDGQRARSGTSVLGDGGKKVRKDEGDHTEDRWERSGTKGKGRRRMPGGSLCEEGHPAELGLVPQVALLLETGKEVGVSEGLRRPVIKQKKKKTCRTEKKYPDAFEARGDLRSVASIRRRDRPPRAKFCTIVASMKRKRRKVTRSRGVAQHESGPCRKGDQTRECQFAKSNSPAKKSLSPTK